MNPQFSQPGGSVSKDVNKQSIARVFSKKKSDISYLKVGSSVNGYAVLFEPTTQTCWFRGTATGNTVSWTINNDVMTLVTSGGSFTLNKAQVWDSVTLSGGNATSLIGTPSGGTLANLLLRTVSPAEFGLENDPTGVKADKNTMAVQKAIRYLNSLGGGRLLFPTGQYTFCYGIWLFDNILIDLNGSICTFKNATFPLRSRACFVMGSSYEVNRDKAMSFYDDGTYINNPNPTNTAYVNLPLGTFLRDNVNKAEIKNAHIMNGHIKATFDSPTANGAYAINMANAMYCTAHDLFFTGFTEAINMGSDTGSETPSCHGCLAHDLYIVQPDQNKTYYSIGFISNSTNCSIQRAIQYLPCAAGTENGSGVATNVVEDCIIEDIFIPSLGITQSSEGVLLNNAKGCVVRNICVRNCKVVVAVYYVSTSYISADKWNHISGITGQGTVALIAVRGKYTTFTGFAADSTTPYEIYFGTTNGSNNRIEQEPASMYFTETSTVKQYWYCNNNYIKGWVVKYLYLRPMNTLVNDKSVAFNWNMNKSVSANDDTTLYFLWEVPPSVKAIKAVKLFAYYNTNAVAKGSNIKIEVRRMIAFDGNANTLPYIEPAIGAISTATVDQQDIAMSAVHSDTVSPGMVITGDTTNGLANSVDILVTFANTSKNSLMKEMEITYLG